MIISLETIRDYPPSPTYTKDCVMFHQHRFVTVKDLCLKESWTDRLCKGRTDRVIPIYSLTFCFNGKRRETEYAGSSDTVLV